MGIFEILPGDDSLTAAGQKICRNQLVRMKHICENVLFLISGFDSELLDEVNLLKNF